MKEGYVQLSCVDCEKEVSGFIVLPKATFWHKYNCPHCNCAKAGEK